ncbi:MAG: hypothetical protein Q3995_07135, partial [Eubacteriales bacterium]|nr:hypothetical protein [Eubacteriales bacterium]
NPGGVSFTVLIISFTTFLKVEKLAQLVEKTFSTSWNAALKSGVFTFDRFFTAACRQFSE